MRVSDEDARREEVSRKKKRESRRTVTASDLENDVRQHAKARTQFQYAEAHLAHCISRRIG